MHAATMIVYGVRDPCKADEMVERGYLDGPIELLQRSRLRHLADERSDRTRTLWPHIFDVLHAPHLRWHASDVARATVERQITWPVELIGVEMLQFVSDEEAKLLRELQGGARPEVTQALAVFVAEGTAKDLGYLQSRSEQSEHRAVGRSLAGIGTIGFDRVTPNGRDAMHSSEVPFLLTAAVGERAPDLRAITGRSETGCRVLEDALGWRIAIWQDLVAMVAAEGTPAVYWPMDHSPEVALAGVGDAVLMRSLQRFMLHMLAARIGSAEADQALDLQRVSHSLRSRLWWSGVSGDPLVAEVADVVAEEWDLADLADETFGGLEALASRAALDASQRQARSAQRLNVLLSVFAVISLALATLSFILDLTSESVDATTRTLLLVTFGLISAATAATGIRQAQRT